MLCIGNFQLVANGGAYKTCMHTQKISFQYSTCIKHVEDDKDIPYHGFKFIPFTNITSRIFNENCLVG